MKKRTYLLLSLCAIVLSFSACKKESTDIPDTSSFFGRFNGFIGSITTEDAKKGGLATYNSTNVVDTGNFSKGAYTSALTSKDFSISITKATLVFNGSGAPSPAEFQGFFTPGAVPFIDTAVFNGIIILYTDKNGTTWNSATGDQTGNVFNITRSQSSGTNVKVQAEFGCKLFDGAGNTLTLTGGMFTGLFKPQ